MSKNKSISLLKAIKPYKQGWCIQVKLIHSWRQKTNYGGDTLELIFADETGAKILCSCKMNYIQRTQRKLSLGEWRLIETFSVSQAGGHVHVSGKDKKKVEFRLLDINGQSIACCLWGKYVEQLEEHLQKSNDPSMILIKVIIPYLCFIDDVQVTNAFDASLIQLDPELPETLALKLRVSNNEFALALTDTKKEKRLTKNQTVHWNNVDIKSISEIMMATVEEDCKIICSIECMDTD
ncbi:hypothetical protein BRARA_B02314 [Brassica rapa]|uniref:Replication protein A 70 kDa DNA-binding subunit B/D first OB fold domain-containing protein n=1 Tax=Brassica campestris TaxID=3711 RepID=A0A398ABN3_BRACM|nr:hypothetical protein BRARA_B02314 [Brassica rapa]